MPRVIFSLLLALLTLSAHAADPAVAFFFWFSLPDKVVNFERTARSELT